MDKYTEYWEEQLNLIARKIIPHIAIDFTLDGSALQQLGDRKTSGYNGFTKLWLAKNEEEFTNSAVFRNLRKQIIKNTKLRTVVFGDLKIEVTNNSNINVSYAPLSYARLLQRYTVIQTKPNYLVEEVYKWELVNLFQEQWNKYTNKEIDFATFYKSINFKNLVYTSCITNYKHVIENKPQEFEMLINYLFDETVDLQQRIFNYRKDFDMLFFSIQGHGKTTYEEERTIATWLTFRYPNKYTFYKDDFYTKLCKGLGITVEKPLYKLVHYYSIVNKFFKQELVYMTSIITNNKKALTPDAYKDENNLILIQDILFSTISAGGNVKDVIDEPEIILDKTKELKLIKKMSQPLNQILYGPPGTGKTYNTINTALKIISEKEALQVDWEDRKAVKKLFDNYVLEGRIAFTTFHQSMSYEDFIEGIKPMEPQAEDTHIKYEVQAGIFKRMCDSAAIQKSNTFDQVYELLLNDIQNEKEQELELKTMKGFPFWIQVNSRNNLNLFTGKNKQLNGTIKKEGLSIEASGVKYYEGWESYATSILQYLKAKYNYVLQGKIAQTKPYILIIDEINRGNVSAIFGELITLIEEDKRIGMPEEIQLQLPYSKKEFGVPSNLYIIGTMNTADRSVEALDTALRRRFSFIEMPPNYSLKELKYELYGYTANTILATINVRIEKLLNKDYALGHAYFIGKNETSFITSFYKNIIPLLQEYFYADYAKIGLVLGKGFVQAKQELENVFADFDAEDAQDFASKTNWEIVQYKVTDVEGFAKAIAMLMNQPIVVSA